MITRVNWDTRYNEYITVFVDKNEFNDELIKSVINQQRTNRAGELLINLTENILMSNKFKINSHEFIITEAMVDSVIMYILENGLRLYNEDKGNAFSYFSRVVFTKGSDFLRARYGKTKRLDLYGQNLKFLHEGEWKMVELVNIDDYNLKEYYGR